MYFHVTHTTIHDFNNNCDYKGELSIGKACVIPMYLPLAVLMALGHARGDLNEWNKLASRMKDGPEQSVYDDHPMNTGKSL